MNNEEINVEALSPDAKFSIFFATLSFERYDLAQKLAGIVAKVGPDACSAFFKERMAQGLQDRQRAVEFLRRNLANDNERQVFDQLVH